LNCSVTQLLPGIFYRYQWYFCDGASEQQLYFKRLRVNMFLKLKAVLFLLLHLTHSYEIMEWMQGRGND